MLIGNEYFLNVLIKCPMSNEIYEKLIYYLFIRYNPKLLDMQFS